MEGLRFLSGGEGGIFRCFLEAALALGAPVELWDYGTHVDYDPVGQEWRCREACRDKPEAVGELTEWMERMCGWLQYKYPAGPSARPEKLSIRR